MQQPVIQVDLEQKAGTLQISLTSDQFAKSVELEFQDEDTVFSDNYFDLIPGRRRTVVVERSSIDHSRPVAELRSKLTVRSVIDTF